MKIYVVVTKKGKICPDFGVWEDEGDAFRNLSEMNENVGEYDVIQIDIKKLFKTVSVKSLFIKKHEGTKSLYYSK